MRSGEWSLPLIVEQVCIGHVGGSRGASHGHNTPSLSTI